MEPTSSERFWARVQAAGVSGRPCERATPLSGRCGHAGGEVQPQNAAEVGEVVAAAAATGVTLHPVSRGRNWGYGSAAPPAAGQVVMNLRRMNRILSVDDELATCVLEPGVSQGQLQAHLDAHHPGLWMDATGAGPDASVLGNSIDRGFGHTRYGDHFAQTCNLEVMLADGRIVRTGFGRLGGAAQDVYAYGLGPMLDGLFTQNGLGVVLRATLWLQPKPACMIPFAVTADGDDALSPLMDRIGLLRRQGLLQTAVHVANDYRALASRSRYPFDRTGGRTPLPQATRLAMRSAAGLSAWSGTGSVQGSVAVARAAMRDVKRALGEVPGVRVLVLSDRRMRWMRRAAGGLARLGKPQAEARLKLAEPALALLRGRPNSEHLRGAFWRVRDLADGAVDKAAAAAELEAGHVGLRWFAPLLPLRGRDVDACRDRMETIYNRHGFEPMMTFTAINERSVVCVSNASFDRRLPTEIEAAEACHAELSEAFAAEGLFPYRGGTGDPDPGPADCPFQDAVQRIRGALDPGRVFAGPRLRAAGQAEPAARAA